METIEIEYNGKNWKLHRAKDGGFHATCKQKFTPKEYLEFFSKKVLPLLNKTQDKQEYPANDKRELNKK